MQSRAAGARREDWRNHSRFVDRDSPTVVVSGEGGSACRLLVDHTGLSEGQHWHRDRAHVFVCVCSFTGNEIGFCPIYIFFSRSLHRTDASVSRFPHTVCRRLVRCILTSTHIHSHERRGCESSPGAMRVTAQTSSLSGGAAARNRAQVSHASRRRRSNRSKCQRQLLLRLPASGSRQLQLREHIATRLTILHTSRGTCLQTTTATAGKVMAQAVALDHVASL